MKPTLQARLSQQLTLTPQLQQSIRLLQLSTLELHQEVEQMLEANPLLELDDEAAPGWDAAQQAEGAERERETERERERNRTDEPEAAAGLTEGPDTDTHTETATTERELAEQDFGTPEREDWANGTEGDDFDGIRELPSLGAASGAGDDDGLDGSARDAAPTTLAEHLRAQLAGLRLAPEDRAAVELLMGSLDADGYLPDGPDALAEAWLPEGKGEGEGEGEGEIHAREALIERLQLARRLLQSLEPAGVGAQDLSECLVLQLQRLTPNPEREVAIAIARSHLELLAKRDLKRLLPVALALGADEDELRWAVELIRSCDPRPGRAFGGEAAAPVVPDVIVRRAGREFRVELNPEVMPRLRINDLYAGALRSARGSSLAGSLQEARWFIKNIQQRFDTILRVSRAIVERQRRYFEHGEVGMRPLVLREIADELGLHESTISRVTTAKYMATPHGTVELKYFFGSGLATDAGGEASSTAVRALIRQLVAAENPKKPLSDGTLAELLADQGIQVARRTVAKYREALKIAPAPQRKAV